MVVNRCVCVRLVKVSCRRRHVKTRCAPVNHATLSIISSRHLSQVSIDYQLVAVMIHWFIHSCWSYLQLRLLVVYLTSLRTFLLFYLLFMFSLEYDCSVSRREFVKGDQNWLVCLCTCWVEVNFDPDEWMGVVGAFDLVSEFLGILTRRQHLRYDLLCVKWDIKP